MLAQVFLHVLNLLATLPLIHCRWAKGWVFHAGRFCCSGGWRKNWLQVPWVHRFLWPRKPETGKKKKKNETPVVKVNFSPPLSQELAPNEGKTGDKGLLNRKKRSSFCTHVVWMGCLNMPDAKWWIGMPIPRWSPNGFLGGLVGWGVG